MKNTMTIDQAFQSLIEVKRFDKLIGGINEITARDLRYRFRQGKLSYEKKKETLEKAGFKIAQVELWAPPVPVEP